MVKETDSELLSDFIIPTSFPYFSVPMVQSLLFTNSFKCIITNTFMPNFIIVVMDQHTHTHTLTHIPIQQSQNELITSELKLTCLKYYNTDFEHKIDLYLNLTGCCSQIIYFTINIFHFSFRLTFKNNKIKSINFEVNIFTHLHFPHEFLHHQMSGTLAFDRHVLLLLQHLRFCFFQQLLFVTLPVVFATTKLK